MADGQIPFFLNFSVWLASNLDLVWTFILLATRFGILLNMMPGIGGGNQGRMVRVGAVLTMAFAASFSSPVAALPTNWVEIITMVVNEAALGFMLGLIPQFAISAIQTAGSLSSTTMGLGAAQLVDPTLGANVTSVARTMGDIGILFFLILGGHHWMVYAASSMGGVVEPGTFIFHAQTIDELLVLSGRIFLGGTMMSAPVIVALLLTQFVMGLVTKAVPQVNIFIVSFPLTIGIGLVLTSLSLPDVLVYVEREFRLIEPAVVRMLQPI